MQKGGCLSALVTAAAPRSRGSGSFATGSRFGEPVYVWNARKANGARSTNTELGTIHYSGTPSEVDKFNSALANGVSIKCLKAVPAPGTAATPPTAGTKVPDPTKTALVVLSFTVSNCQST
jgi:hypothetical protein